MPPFGEVNLPRIKGTLPAPRAGTHPGGSELMETPYDEWQWRSRC